MDLVRLSTEIERLRIDALARIDRVPIAALVWGPNPTSTDLIAQTRLALRDELRKRGHLAEFSEDLIDPASSRDIFAQQLAQAEAFDIVFSLPATYGAIGEIHDFARIIGLSHKITAFIDRDHVSGYSATSLMAAQSVATCSIELYDKVNLPNQVIDCALGQIFRLQELHYIMGRR